MGSRCESCRRFDGDSKFPVGRMAGLRGAGGDVVALGAGGLARALSLRDRAVLFPDADRFPDHADPAARANGLRGRRREMAFQGLRAFPKAADDADPGAVLRGDAFRDHRGRSGHPAALAGLLRALVEFPHGVHGGLAIGDGALLDAGDPGAVLSGVAAGGFPHASEAASGGVSRLRGARARFADDPGVAVSGNPSQRDDHFHGDGLFRRGRLARSRDRPWDEGGRRKAESSSDGRVRRIHRALRFQ